MIDGILANVPTISLSDLREIITVNKVDEGEQKQPAMSRKAIALASGNQELINDRYGGDESRAEMALGFVPGNSGFEYPEIKHIFDTWPCAGGIQQASAPSTKMTTYSVPTAPLSSAWPKRARPVNLLCVSKKLLSCKLEVCRG